MSKHTPGPWRYQEESDHYTHIVRAGETGLGRFVVQCGQSRDGIEEANARLIAAAPEMLEALKTLVAMWEDAMSNNHKGWQRGVSDLEIRPDGKYKLSDARAAIAKAEGRS